MGDTIHRWYTGAVRRLIGLGLAVPVAALGAVLALVADGSVLERVYFGAFPGLLALRLALGKGRAPGYFQVLSAGALGALVAVFFTSHPVGDQPYPWVERARYAALVAGVFSLPLVALLPFRRFSTRSVALLVAWVVYAPVAFAALQVHRPHVRPVWAQAGTEPRRIEVEATDGVVLRGWSWPGRAERSPLVVLLHGIGASRTDLVHLGRIYRARGWAVGMFDSRGHGESDSMTVTFGYRERTDVAAIVHRLTGGDASVPVALHGCSMGAAIALQAAATLPQVRAVIAEAPFYDLETVAADGLAVLPGPLAAAALAIFRALAPFELGGPLEDVSPAHAIATRRDLRSLIIVGERDVIVPADQGRRLHQRAAGPSQLWDLPNAEHCSAWAAARQEFPVRVSDVLREAFRDAAPRGGAARPAGRGAKAPRP
jgi:uncharacterized protein